jgi:hypothetical protein
MRAGYVVASVVDLREVNGEAIEASPSRTVGVLSASSCASCCESVGAALRALLPLTAF